MSEYIVEIEGVTSPEELLFTAFGK